MFSWRRTAVRKRVLVNLKTDKALTGVLWAKRGRLLIIKDTQLLEAGRQPLGMDGEAIIELDNVDFVQVLPEGR